MSSPTQKTGIAIAALAILAFGGVAINSVFVVSARATRLAGAEMDVYRVDSDRLLAIGADQIFLINKADRVVVRPSALGRRYGPLLVWPRSSLEGVILGDGVKGDDAESFSFDPTGVTIRYQAGGHPQSVRVPFE